MDSPNPYSANVSAESKDCLITSGDLNAFQATPADAKDLFAVIFAIVFPTLVTLVYFQWLKDSESSLQQVAYAGGKILQFGFPITWVLLFYRQKLKTKSINSGLLKKQMLFGVGFGALICAAMFVIYFGLIAGTETGTNLVAMVKEKVSGLGVDSLWKYAALGCFYALCHSFMEEYYWRWFVFDYLQKFVPTWTANIVSSLGFAAHHVILLAFFFGWGSPLTYLLSFCIAIGGSFWAWQYRASGLRAPWLSHMLVDAGIFALGYFLIKALL